jgi:hypothetical protein
MSSTKPYIPSNNSDFNLFEVNLNTEVTANALAWGVPAAQAGLLTTWSTGYAPIYAAVSNKETRSRQQVLAHKTYRQDYVTFLRPFCQAFLTNNILISVDVRKSLGLNPRGVNPPSERPTITSAPIVELKPLGGGTVRFAFKVSQSNRIGRQPNSDGVMIYFKLVSPGGIQPPLPPEPIIPQLNEDYPSSDAESGLPTKDGYETQFSTRASFTAQLGISEIGKTMHIYAQWVNTSDTSKNGPFSMVSTLVVS